MLLFDCYFLSCYFLSYNRSEHILSFTNKAKWRIHLLSAFKYSMSRYALFRCYFSSVRPLLEYADIIFDNCFKQEKLMIENLQYAALRLVTGAKKGTSRELLLKDCGLCTMQNRRTFHKLSKLFSIINHQGPSYLENCLPSLSGGEHRVTISKTCKYFRLFYCTSEQFRLAFTCPHSFMHSFIQFQNEITQISLR